MREFYFETKPNHETQLDRESPPVRMDAPLSAYWVRFFKNAGFPSDVATKHAVIFSNNRIKPDMLPDLDKPSLKEMGIALMGDMIAILRYAKKVVEETTCKKFLVSSEDSPNQAKAAIAVKPPVVKKVIAKPTLIKTPVVTKVKMEAPKKVVKNTSSTIAKPSVTVKKKPSPITQTSRLYSDYIDNNQAPKISSLKRKYVSDVDDDDDDDDNDNDVDDDDDDDDDDVDGDDDEDDEDDEDDDEDDDVNVNNDKRRDEDNGRTANIKWTKNDSEKRLKTNDDDIKYKVIMPKGTTLRSQKILKKALEQKRTVFHRLGDSMVTSTTGIAESPNSNFNPTFNITGIGKDLIKRNSSVFNRLGNKDSNKNDTAYPRPLRNGSAAPGTQGILKTRSTLFAAKGIISTKPILKAPVGTMRADEEAKKKGVSESVRQLVRSTKSLKFSDSPMRSNASFARKIPITGTLASERMALPAKSRLGVSKQVTFNKMTTINHIKKHGVFSRLGV